MSRTYKDSPNSRNNRPPVAVRGSAVSPSGRPAMSALLLPELLHTYRARELQLARETLSEFVLTQAEQTRLEVGFGWIPRPDAPSKFDILRATFERAACSGEPLPVSDEHCDSVIFTGPRVNFALRYWHDVNHVRRNLTFDLTDELELSLWHLSVLEASGFGRGTLVWQLLHVDLVGQVYVMALSRRFPLDQARFAGDCIHDGFDQGVLAEIRRQA